MTSGKVRYLLIGIAISLACSFGASIAARVNNDDFAIADVTLGMDIDSVLKIYPAATIEIKAPGCYSYGKRTGDAAMAGRVLRYRDGVSQLTLSFAGFRSGGHLTRIDYDYRVDPARFDFRGLLERLVSKYGAYDRIIHRRKMEPAGRIIGFEWITAERANLRVVLHDDFRTSTDRYRLSFLARSAFVEPRGKACRQSACSACIGP